MPHIIRVLLLFFAFIATSTSMAATQVHSRWWAEQPKYEYYYLQIEVSEQTLKDFYALQLQHGWKQDVSGITQLPYVQARLFRERSTKNEQWLPFRQNKSWFNDVTSKSPVSYEMPGHSKKTVEFINSMTLRGYKQGLMKVDSESFKNIVTFYK
jgi:hypothetical protein